MTDPSGCHAGNKLKQDKGRIRETSEEPRPTSKWKMAAARTRGSRGGGERWEGSGSVLKAEPQIW